MPSSVSATVQVFSVVFVSMPKKRETSQKPESLTWLAKTEPAREVRVADDDGLDERRRCRQRHGGRTLCDAHDRGDDEAGDDDGQAEGGQ